MTNKIKLLAVFILLFTTKTIHLQAQVKFGNNPATVNSNSVLELEHTMKGLLLPRVALSAVNLASPLSAHVAGMMVYNTATAGTAPYNVTPGIYYNNGINWERVVSNSPPIVSTLTCGSATFSPTTASGAVAYTGNATVPYTGGNGATYSAGTGITSTGVTGLTATLQAGTLAFGAGNITYSISGTPSAAGTATFALSFGGQTCNLTLTVSGPSITSISCGTATTNPVNPFATVGYVGTATVPYTGGNGLSYTAGTGISSTGVTGLTATLQAGTLATGAGNLTYNISGTASAAGTATFALSFGGQSCNLSVTVSALSGLSPSVNITLAQDQNHFITSIYDQNYLPYSAPTGAASTTRPSNPDGTNETVTLNVQGTLSTTGITVYIPITPTGSGTLAAYNASINIPANLTEDGISRDVTLSWASQTYTASTKSIVANLKAEVGTLNALKLDINAGLGSTYDGVLMGQIPYPYLNNGTTTNFALRIIPAIPDKMFGLADNNSNTTTHLMLYTPITAEDGNVWLNNNLGAHYSNLNHGSFNLTAQATSATDYLAYGSYIQWGRKPDGHELITFTNATTGTLVNGTTTTLSNAPTHANFIIHNSSPYDWRTTPDTTLWASVSAANNPCPAGFRVPTVAEYTNLKTAANITNAPTAAASRLKFTLNGLNTSGGTLTNAGVIGYYWTNDGHGLSDASSQYFWNAGEQMFQNNVSRVQGFGVRCIKN
jgi:hypothetical protein